MIEQASSGSANQRRGPEKPELRKSPVADKKGGTRAARRINRRIRHRNADKVNQREAKSNRDRSKAGWHFYRVSRP
jgi:hypothetical protein